MMFHMYISFDLFIFISYILVSAEGQNIPSSWQSVFKLFGPGLEFSPVDMTALFLQETSVGSTCRCAKMCHSITLCRTFDFDADSHRCRIFQGDLNTTGSIIFSSSSRSIVGSVKLQPTQFTNFGQPCSYYEDSQYLKCMNSTCQCQSNTYFDGSICRSQKLLGAVCMNRTECRIDRNYTCLPRQQCGPLSLQNGTTVGGYENGTTSSTDDALNEPFALAVDIDDSLYVSDSGNNRVMRLRHGSTLGTRVAGSNCSGSTMSDLNGPTGLYVDTLSNIYIDDDMNYRIMLWRNGSSAGEKMVGTGTRGSTLQQLGKSVSLTVDSHGNIYVSEQRNHRVTRWAPNTTNATVVAGEDGVSGNQSNQLDTPGDIYLDELHSHLYIADTGNHRIQRVTLGISTAAITVAGGNGEGSGDDQLNDPTGVYVSKKTGAVYIADSDNHRITRWDAGAISGVTIVGITRQSGTSPMLLNNPVDLAMNGNETFLYVSDSSNNRIQRFQLI